MWFGDIAESSPVCEKLDANETRVVFLWDRTDVISTHIFLLVLSVDQPSGRKEAALPMFGHLIEL